MTERKNILIVDDEEFIRLTLKQLFVEENYHVHMVDNGTDAIKFVKDNEVDLALLDINLPDINGIDVLKEFKLLNPDLLVIVATGYASVDSAIEALKLGAYDYIKKPFKADAIKLITRLALETQTLKKTVQQLRASRPKLSSLDTIIGKSENVLHMKHQIEEFAKVGSETVLITGESGSGKELIAQALHSLSPRSENEFVEINCASIPANLLESELFGYEKGAFTDAKERKIGLIEKAIGGTLFLDEIGEMGLQLQASLLRIIENKKLRRLGSTEDIDIDVRIIAATNRNLKDAIESKEFRSDLYYRLNVLSIQVPSLKERSDDIPILVEHFIDHFNSKFNKKILKCSEDALSILTKYDWPGNIRELKNTIERICILHKGDIIEAHHLPEDLLFHHAEENNSSEIEGSDEFAFEEILRNTEIQLLKKAYLQSGKNSSKAARLLKIPRETFRYKLSKYNLENGEN
ncbi:MAG: sigma-54-dependent Fis family transcriptional regulator [Calditrichaeota bacterium]|nr:MAG: sigma-54-dependent Fis family transcriptional regulator [Calditrichota bacterium]